MCLKFADKPTNMRITYSSAHHLVCDADCNPPCIFEWFDNESGLKTAGGNNLSPSKNSNQVACKASNAKGVKFVVFHIKGKNYF